MSDRRDRDELTDRDDLAALIMGDVPFEEDYDTFHNEALRIADAILAAGWVHWPHDCDTEAELIAQWAQTSFETMQELHRLTAENAGLRRRLVELAALDPADEPSP